MACPLLGFWRAPAWSLIWESSSISSGVCLSEYFPSAVSSSIYVSSHCFPSRGSINWCGTQSSFPRQGNSLNQGKKDHSDSPILLGSALNHCCQRRFSWVCCKRNKRRREEIWLWPCDRGSVAPSIDFVLLSILWCNNEPRRTAWNSRTWQSWNKPTCLFLAILVILACSSRYKCGIKISLKVKF